MKRNHGRNPLGDSAAFFEASTYLVSVGWTHRRIVKKEVSCQVFFLGTCDDIDPVAIADAEEQAAG